jgi:hypothetical protein
MKYFGEFLVQQKIISEDQLLMTLVEQVKSTPSLVEIAFENHFFPSSQLLSVLRLQHQENISFIGAAQKLNLWSEELAHKAHEVTSAKRAPLGELLVSRGLLKVEQLSKFLDEFFAKREVPTAPAGSPVTLAASVTEPSVYCESFTKGFYEDCKRLFDSLAAGGVDIELLKNNVEQWHRVLGAAKLEQWTLSASLVAKIEQVVLLLSKKDFLKMTAELRGQARTALQSALSLVWAVRQEIESGAGEKNFESPEKKKKIQETLDVLEVLNFDLELV